MGDSAATQESESDIVSVLFTDVDYAGVTDSTLSDTAVDISFFLILMLADLGKYSQLVGTVRAAILLNWSIFGQGDIQALLSDKETQEAS